MKSWTSPTPVSVKNRVTRMAVSGKYIWEVRYPGSLGRMRKRPPCSSSSRAPNTLGESNLGQQNQSTDPSVVTSAQVCRSPMSPCSAIAVSVMGPALREVPAPGVLAGPRHGRTPVHGAPHPCGVRVGGGSGDQAGGPPNRHAVPRHRVEVVAVRRFVAGLLIVISALSLLLASTSLWTRRHVVNTEVFVSDTQQVLAEPAVQNRIADLVTTTIMTNPDVVSAVDDAVAALPPGLQRFRSTVRDGVQSLITTGVTRLLSSDAATRLTDATLTSAHDQLVAGKPVQFTLGQAKGLVPADRLGGLAGQVLGLVPDNIGFTVVTPADNPRLYNLIDLLKSVWWWLGLVALGTLAGALGVSRHRRATLRAWAVTTVVL